MKNRPLPEIRPAARRAVASAGVMMVLLLVGSAGVSAIDVVELEKATATILCDCGCHPQSVKDCACGRAAQMRTEIADLIAGADSGIPRSADAVVALYVAEHGEQILVAPPAHGFNLFAWLTPFVVLVAAIIGVALLIRRWTVRPSDSTAVSGALGVLDPDDPYLARLQHELEERR